MLISAWQEKNQTTIVCCATKREDSSVEQEMLAFLVPMAQESLVRGIDYQDSYKVLIQYLVVLDCSKRFFVQGDPSW